MKAYTRYTDPIDCEANKPIPHLHVVGGHANLIKIRKQADLRAENLGRERLGDSDGDGKPPGPQHCHGDYK